MRQNLILEERKRRYNYQLQLQAQVAKFKDLGIHDLVIGMRVEKKIKEIRKMLEYKRYKQTKLKTIQANNNTAQQISHIKPK